MTCLRGGASGAPCWGQGSGRETPFALSASGGRRSLDQTLGRGEGKQLGLRQNFQAPSKARTDPRLSGKMARETMRDVGQGGLGEERMLLREVSQIGSSCPLPSSPESTSLLSVSKAPFVDVRARARQ